MSNTNARDEFVKHTVNIDSKIKAATISKEYSYDWCKQVPVAELKIGYSEQDLDNFIEKMNFTYDSGYGGQELFGTIWYEDGTWSDRGEYDGSEWWQYNAVPEIPEELK